ncbi:DRTGG domain protein [Halothece sp. PCC 7418]|uniref:phosphotransacetylase family protein n=1 Tax=Halothece sp. (strain PCC 7418) TaxID=65093 RepID=UPI0002A07FB0|nr:phosphotransacetylase family protein [Halothece sp. PCC 7418]AFZ44156.1 DRTGG domain protein [Halothece sp. PCC 7418]
MAKTAKSLIIASVEAYSGKSATILGLAHQLRNQGLTLSYSKPVGSYLHQEETETVEDDVQFIAKALELSQEQVGTPLINLSPSVIAQTTKTHQIGDYSQALKDYIHSFDRELCLIEAPATLAEGSLFTLSTQQMSETLNAPILLVVRYHSLRVLDQVLAAQKQLGNQLLGVVINDIPPEAESEIRDEVKPFLEKQGVSVFGMLPQSDLLHSVSVRELTKQLSAEVLCRRDRLDLMVERLTIGAMNVNSALKYFRKGKNLAVVTGGDRSDLQLAALETSAHCLILTGHVPPQDFILSRAETLEIPILAVEFDTLTTVEVAERTFKQVRIQEPIKVRFIQDLMSQHFDVDRLINQLGVQLV